MPLDIVEKILGHTDIESTMRYAHIVEESHVEAVDPISDVFGGTPVAQPPFKRAAND